jgi:hypothetical protein
MSGTEGNHLPVYSAEVKNASSWLGAYFSTGRFSPSHCVSYEVRIRFPGTASPNGPAVQSRDHRRMNMELC